MPPSRTSRRSAPTPTPAPSTTPSTNLNSNTPSYEIPVAPLNADSHAKLTSILTSTATTKKLQERLERAQKLLGECAGEIGDKRTDRKSDLNKRKRGREKAIREGNENGEHDDALADLEESVAETERKVEAMTKRMESALRKTIDGYAGVDSLDRSVKELARTSSTAAERASQYQSQLQSQQHSQRNAAADQAMDSDVDVTQIPNTARSQATAQAPPAPAPPQLVPLFKESLQRHMDRYTSLSLTQRYADHNEYATFKKVTHDAEHPEGEGPALPHKRFWFAAEEGRAEPAPGVTGRQAVEGDSDVEVMDESDDSDIAIARVKISTRCPLSLMEFVDPVTSNECKHSYERENIMSMIRAQVPPTRGRGGEVEPGWVAGVQCPVAGCERKVTEEDLVHDAVLVRKIKRIQRAKLDAAAGGEEEDGIDEVESDSEDDVDRVADVSATMRSIKGERARSRAADEIEDDDD